MGEMAKQELMKLNIGSRKGEVEQVKSKGDVAQLRQALELAVKTKKKKGQGSIDDGDYRSWTAFHVACASGNMNCVRLLINAGCNTALRNADGLTGWEVAAHMGHMV